MGERLTAPWHVDPEALQGVGSGVGGADIWCISDKVEAGCRIVKGDGLVS